MISTNRDMGLKDHVTVGFNNNAPMGRFRAKLTPGAGVMQLIPSVRETLDSEIWCEKGCTDRKS